MHHPRDRKYWRTLTPLPGRLVAGRPLSQAQDRGNAYEPVRGSDWARLLPERYHERMIFMTVLRGIAWLGDWSKVLGYMVGTKPAFFCFVYAEVIV